MFLLHVELNVKPGAQNALEDTFAEIFVPAISQQHGFKDVKLLRPAENGGGDYRLSIAFDDQASQRNWVATDLHGKVWPQMEDHCLGFSVKNYLAV
jgi:heme-degrading monooxygenase HmoA